MELIASIFDVFFVDMGGNYMSALEKPIRHGDIAELNQVLDRYGPVTPLLLSKKFVPEDNCCGFSVMESFHTPLQYCITQNQPHCLRVLLDAGGDPREKCKLYSRFLRICWIICCYDGMKIAKITVICNTNE